MACLQGCGSTPVAGGLTPFVESDGSTSLFQGQEKVLCSRCLLFWIAIGIGLVLVGVLMGRKG